MHMIDIMKMYLSEGWIFLRISLMPLFSENFIFIIQMWCTTNVLQHDFYKA